MNWLRKNVVLFLMASLTLGLAPFNPPHIWGKLTWVFGGGAFSGPKPMLAADWLDLLLHGAPWVFLILGLVSIAVQKLKA